MSMEYCVAYSGEETARQVRIRTQILDGCSIAAPLIVMSVHGANVDGSPLIRAQISYTQARGAVSYMLVMKSWLYGDPAAPMHGAVAERFGSVRARQVGQCKRHMR
jgi:hypothetical protein